MYKEIFIDDIKRLKDLSNEPTLAIICTKENIVKENLIKELLNIGATWFYFWNKYAEESENFADEIIESLDKLEIVTISNLVDDIEIVKNEVNNLQINTRHLFIND